MPVNPYESPGAVEESYLPQQTLPVLANAMISPFFVATAGVAGTLLFNAVVEVLYSLEAREYSFHVGGCFGAAAVFTVLMFADWFLHLQLPAWGSAVIGMLLAWPLALAFALCLGFVAYVLDSALMSTLSEASYFLTFSLGGWLAICRMRNIAVSKNQISD